jgi:transposase-like protein
MDMKEFVKQFDYFVQIYNENVSMQVDDFRTKDHETVNSTINKLINQIEEIERLDVRSSLRIVRLDGEKMKRRIRESPK